jgi:hypothetical protein
MPVPIASRGGLTGGASAMNLSIRQFLHPGSPGTVPVGAAALGRRRPRMARGVSHLHGMRAHGSTIGRGGLRVQLRKGRDPEDHHLALDVMAGLPLGDDGAPLFNCRPTAKCRSQADDGHRLAAYRRWRTNRRPKGGRR